MTKPSVYIETSVIGSVASRPSRDLITAANQQMTHVPLPDNAQVDALHIAVAAANGMDYLLTWNCAHIANASLRPKIEEVCQSCGLRPPTICTPQELMET